MNIPIDAFGVPWLGAGLIVFGVIVAGFLSIVFGKTVRQLRSGAVNPRVEIDDDPVTDPGIKRGVTPKRVATLKPTKAAKGPNNNYRDVHSPMGLNGSRTWFNRISPLFYEESKDGKWKMSMGRVAFWMVLGFFLGMCTSVQLSLGSETRIDPNLPTLYLGVISMLFLLTLGLLGYNLGSKFTDPMSKFIVLWAQKGNVTQMQGQSVTQVQVQAAPAPTAVPAVPAIPAKEEGMPSPDEDPEA